MPIFGCVADDFTGASDAASFLVKGGMSVQLFNGIPAKGSRVGEGIQAIVIALKSRTQDTGEAVADTLRALGWLKEQVRSSVRQGIAGGLLGQGGAEIRDAPANGRVY